MANVELPKDVEGREIPLDTECLYTYRGEKQDVLGFTYRRKEERWEIETDSRIVNSIYLYITPPDSWEKLEADLDKCIEADDCCRYYSASGSCAKCARPDNDGGGCTTVVFSDIKKRIRKLRGEGE